MKSYAPLDNVAAQRYPHMLVTAGLHDPRVGGRAGWLAGGLHPPLVLGCQRLPAKAPAQHLHSSCLSSAPLCATTLQPTPPPTHPAQTPPLPKVGYWEPAKLVAKLREVRTNPEGLLLFKCDMGAGHFSVTGRFERLREKALEFAFLLKVQRMAGAGQVSVR
jgi:hypothetical protein